MVKEREREREKSRSLCNSFVMIHPKVMTDTDRLIKGFGGFIFFFCIYMYIWWWFYSEIGS